MVYLTSGWCSSSCTSCCSTTYHPAQPPRTTTQPQTIELPSPHHCLSHAAHIMMIHDHDQNNEQLMSTRGPATWLKLSQALMNMHPQNSRRRTMSTPRLKEASKAKGLSPKWHLGQTRGRKGAITTTAVVRREGGMDHFEVRLHCAKSSALEDVL